VMSAIFLFFCFIAISTIGKHGTAGLKLLVGLGGILVIALIFRNYPRKPIDRRGAASVGNSHAYYRSKARSSIAGW
jgi:hypothetical protein